jgi:hypothetical protein
VARQFVGVARPALDFLGPSFVTLAHECPLLTRFGIAQFNLHWCTLAPIRPHMGS